MSICKPGHFVQLPTSCRKTAEVSQSRRITGNSCAEDNNWPLRAGDIPKLLLVWVSSQGMWNVKVLGKESPSETPGQSIKLDELRPWRI